MKEDDTPFAADLYRGTAAYYDRYRLPYPARMLADLVARARVGGNARLLDAACGTGQLAFPLRRYFAEVWAVDQEPDMVDVVRAKASAAGPDARVRAVVSRAEDLGAPPGYFDLIVIGNAFHRLDRDAVARRSLELLKPDGRLALCWSSSPWAGDAAWQQAFAQTLTRWRSELGVERRIPAGWEQARQQRPDALVLGERGFAAAGRREFTVEHRWTLPELAGHVRSTSFLPPSALADRAAAFDADLAARLAPFAEDGMFPEVVGFAYDLFRPSQTS